MNNITAESNRLVALGGFFVNFPLKCVVLY